MCKREILRRYIVDCNTLTTLWGDILRKATDTELMISLNNYMEARDSYLQLIKELADKKDFELLKQFKNDNISLEHGLLFKKQIEEHLKEFVKSNHVFSNTFLINSEQNIKVTFYRGFNIKNDFDMAKWVEEVIAYGFWCKTNDLKAKIYTCNKDISDLIIESKLGINYEYIDLNSLCS